MYGGLCHGAYLQGMMQICDMFRQLGWSYTLSMMFNESLIPRARNALVAQFLKSDCTHLFFIDADIRFNAAEIGPMVESGKDVICGIYPKKEINWPAIRNAINAGVPDNQLKFYSGSFVVNLVNYEGSVTVPINTAVEIWEGGTGFMMIRRNAFEQVEPHCEWYHNDVHGSAAIREKITEYFATSIIKIIDEKGEEYRRLLSEDYHFCHTWRNKCGGKVYAAPWVTLAHFGTYAFEGQLMRHDVPAGKSDAPASPSEPKVASNRRPRKVTIKKKNKSKGRKRK